MQDMWNWNLRPNIF